MAAVLKTAKSKRIHAQIGSESGLMYGQLYGQTLLRGAATAATPPTRTGLTMSATSASSPPPAASVLRTRTRNQPATLSATAPPRAATALAPVPLRPLTLLLDGMGITEAQFLSTPAATRWTRYQDPDGIVLIDPRQIVGLLGCAGDPQ
jgi:hypothetical protein